MNALRSQTIDQTKMENNNWKFASEPHNELGGVCRVNKVLSIQCNYMDNSVQGYI